MRVVIVHDFMEAYGGAERVLAEIAATFPDAPVYAILGRRDVAERIGVADRFHSLLPAGERLLRNYRALAPAFPALADRLPIPDCDVVVSSSYGFAHRLGPKRPATRVCYCHSPLRFAWTMTRGYREQWSATAPAGRAFELFAAAMRRSDRRSSAQVDTYVTQSPYVADQIERFYGRRAEIVGVPVDCDRFVPSSGPAGDHFLFCGRLVEPYKKAALLLETFRRMPDERLVVAGDGPAGAGLRARAPGNVEFIGRLEDDALVGELQRCKALIFPSRDDFGLMPVEAMACGRPVLAYGAGGALQTVRPGVTGELFDEQTPEAVAAAVRAFDPGRFDPITLRRHAERWDASAFRARIREVVERAASPAPQPPVRMTAPDLAIVRAGRFNRDPTGGEVPSPAPSTSVR